MNIHARYERAAPDTNKTSRIIPHGAMTVLWRKTRELQDCRMNGFTGKVIGSQPDGEQQRLFSGWPSDVRGGTTAVGRSSAVKRGALTGPRPLNK